LNRRDTERNKKMRSKPNRTAKHAKRIKSEQLNVHNEGRAPLLRASLSIVVLAGAWFDSCLVEGMNRSPAAALE